MAEQDSSINKSANVISPEELESTQKSHKCHFKECTSSFETKENLEEHILLHTATEHFKLPISTRLFLYQSKQSTVEIKSYKCLICKLAFRTCSDLARHLDGHNVSEAHTCKVCDKRCKKTYLFLQHIQLHYFANTNLKYACNFCEEEFTRERLNDLRAHLYA